MSLYRLHRPKKFEDLIGQDHIRDTLKEAVKQNMLAHAYLFTGPRGTGKTTTARLIAKVANCLDILNQQQVHRGGKKVSGKTKVTGEPCNKCERCLEISDNRSMDIIEIDAASNRGIDEIRELRENVKFAPTSGTKKVYIIDEVHMLTREAFNALLKTLEEPPDHAMFVLATTEPHKIPATIISRTQRFDFKRITKKDIISSLKKISKLENIEIDHDSLELIAAAAEGGLRDAISLLDQASSFKKKLKKIDIEKILGIASQAEAQSFLGAIFSKNPEEGLKIAQRLHENGYNLAQFNAHVIENLRRILLYVSSGEILFEDTKENVEQIKRLTKKYFSDSGKEVVKEILKYIEIFIESAKLLKEISYPILPIEMAVIEATSLDDEIPARRSYASSVADGQTNQKLKVNNQDDQPKTLERTDDGQATIIDSEKSEVPKADVSVEVSESSEAQEKLPEHVNFEAFSDDVWQNVIDTTKTENNTLAALLRDARPIGAEQEHLIVGVKFKFHQDKISEAKNISILEGVIHKVSGQSIKVKCKIADLRPKARKPSSDDDLQKAAAEIFEQ